MPPRSLLLLLLLLSVVDPVSASQILYLLLSTALIGLVPSARLRRFSYNYVALVCFRILSRSFSAVIKFHNKKHRKGRREKRTARHDSCFSKGSIPFLSPFTI